MTARIWPGALCYITHPTLFGKPVEALHEAPVGVNIKLPDGYGQEGAPVAGCWVCKSLGEPFHAPCVNGFKRVTPYAVIPSRWLRPITPPPGSESTQTDDTAPCEVEVLTAG